jgi:O-antigen ligase
MLTVRKLWVHFGFISLLIIAIWFSVSASNITAGSSFFGDVAVRVGDTFNMENKTTQGRLTRWEDSIEILQSNPILGLGRFPIYTAHISEDRGNLYLLNLSETERGAHNAFVNKLLHEGLAGVLILCVFIVLILKSFKSMPLSERTYLAFLRVFILSFILFCLFNTSFESVSGRMFFIFSLGLLNVEIIRNYSALSVEKRQDLASLTSPLIGTESKS